MNGSILIGLGTKEQMEPLNLDRSIFNLYSLKEVEIILLNAGFYQVKIYNTKGKSRDLSCVVAYKKG